MSGNVDRLFVPSDNPCRRNLLQAVTNAALRQNLEVRRAAWDNMRTSMMQSTRGADTGYLRGEVCDLRTHRRIHPLSLSDLDSGLNVADLWLCERRFSSTHSTQVPHYGISSCTHVVIVRKPSSKIDINCKVTLRGFTYGWRLYPLPCIGDSLILIHLRSQLKGLPWVFLRRVYCVKSSIGC